jgi:hypothetical protein
MNPSAAEPQSHECVRPRTQERPIANGVHPPQWLCYGGRVGGILSATPRERCCGRGRPHSENLRSQRNLSWIALQIDADKTGTKPNWTRTPLRRQHAPRVGVARIVANKKSFPSIRVNWRNSRQPLLFICVYLRFFVLHRWPRLLLPIPLLSPFTWHGRLSDRGHSGRSA